MFADIVIDFLERKLPALFLVAGMSLILSHRQKTENANLYYLWSVAISGGVLAVVEFAEWHLTDPSMVLLRTLTSVVCYILRSQCVLGLLLAVENNRRLRRRLWIPQIVLIVVMLFAFVPTHLVFWYDAEGSFYRGPLGYVAFIVPLFYVFLLVKIIYRRFRDNSRWEAWLIILCLIFCIAEMTIESVWSGGNLETVLLIAALLFFIFIRFQDTDRDALTGLKNRSVYYTDRERYEDIITAVAFIDLNGLKFINDVIGHDEGDRSLHIVGDVLLSVTSKDVHAYRIGGDEFVLLFTDMEQKDVEKVITEVRLQVHRNGLSVAIGCAVRTDRESVRDLTHLADQNMYADKAAYYQQRQYNRRK